jgi:hypothetical protein
VAHDLDERPDLTPWLAGVFVFPEARGRAHVVHLIQAVEAACRSAAIPVVCGSTPPVQSACTRVLGGVAWKLYNVLAGVRSRSCGVT